MLTQLAIDGRRIVALLPIIAGPFSSSAARLEEIEVVTTDDTITVRPSFTLHRVRPNGDALAPPRTFTTLPAALRAMRQAGGWG